ncbi:MULTISPECIES: MsnO8 family LLM class oxidoreductase [Paenibacillus]|uniref:MsnO8 family LLM class oxidoreductase n=1 Tax=Paenibacillus TaxID=44249 RepID=UPI002FE0EB48
MAERENQWRRLRLSVLDLVPKLGGCSDEEALRQAVLLAQRAEEWGYRRYWAAEHHNMDGLACPSPEVLLAHIGAVTTRIKLGSGALLLPHYAPLKAAEWFRMLAALYPGRIDLGLGRAPGGDAHTAMALSGNFLQHVARYRESVAELLALLQDSYTYESRPVAARPVPLRQPDVWMLGTNVKSAGYAAELGTGYVFGQFMSESDGIETLRVYRKAFRPSVLRAEPETIVAVQAICAPTEREARAMADLIEAELAARGGQLPRQRLAGTPEQLAEQLFQLQRLYGNEEFLIVTAAPDYETRLNSYRLLSGCGFHID